MRCETCGHEDEANLEDDELDALNKIVEQFKRLNRDDRVRVLEYVVHRFPNPRPGVEEDQ